MPQNNFNSVRVRFEFDFISVNDRIMAIDISDQDLLINPDSPGIRTIEFDLIIPSEIKMIFSGKNQDLDTILDGNNNIVQDLCAQDLASFLTSCEDVCKYNQQHLDEFTALTRRDFPKRFFQFLEQHG